MRSSTVRHRRLLTSSSRIRSPHQGRWFEVELQSATLTLTAKRRTSTHRSLHRIAEGNPNTRAFHAAQATSTISTFRLAPWSATTLLLPAAAPALVSAFSAAACTSAQQGRSAWRSDYPTSARTPRVRVQRARRCSSRCASNFSFDSERHLSVTPMKWRRCCRPVIIIHIIISWHDNSAANKREPESDVAR